MQGQNNALSPVEVDLTSAELEVHKAKAMFD